MDTLFRHFGNWGKSPGTQVQHALAIGTRDTDFRRFLAPDYETVGTRVKSARTFAPITSSVQLPRVARNRLGDTRDLLIGCPVNPDYARSPQNGRKTHLFNALQQAACKLGHPFLCGGAEVLIAWILFDRLA